MNYSQFVNSNVSYNVAILNGDSFLADKCVEVFKQKLDIKDEYDITNFDNENFTYSALFEACEQMSFFARHRLVIVKNISKISENDKKSLKNYIKNMNKLTTVVFIDNIKVFDFLEVTTINLNLNDYEIKDYINKTLKSYNKFISEEAVTVLINYALKDLGKITLELQKLSAYVGDRSEITTEDIKLLVPQSEELVIYELTNMLGEKNKSQTLKVLNKLLGSPDNNMKLFSLMSNNFVRMFFASVSKNISDSQLALKFNVKEFAIKKIREQAKIFSPSALKDIMYKLCEVEYMIKHGEMEIVNALYYITLYILHR